MSSCFTCGPLPTEFLLPNIPHDDVALLRQQKVDGLLRVRLQPELGECEVCLAACSP